MHKEGHLGGSFPGYSPVIYPLVAGGHLTVAMLGVVGIAFGPTLPDIDREGTHSRGAPVTGGRNVSAVCGSADCAGESAPVETFSLLANEDRLAILKAVVQADERG